MTTTEARAVPTTGVAARLAEALRPFVGGDLPVRLRAWDGSEAGPDDGSVPLVELRSVDAVRRLLWHPGELGAAQAYVTGELDVPEQDGWNLDAALTHAFRVARDRGLSGGRPTPAAVAHLVRTATGLGALGRPPAPPASQARVRGRLHSQLRDRRAISHHYDLSNEFYSLILEPTMAYSCGYHASPQQPLQEAQEAKLLAGLRKLGLREGMTVARRRLRLGLDVAARGRALRGPRRRGDDRGRAEEVHRRPHRRAGARRPRRDPALRLPRRRRRVRRRVLHRDGRARRPAQLPDVRRGAAPLGEARAAGSWCSRCRAAAAGPVAGPSSSPSSHPTCTCAPSARRSASSSAAGLEVRDVHALREHYVLTVAGVARALRAQHRPADRARGRGGRPRLAALPGRRRHGLPRRPHGRRPDPHGPPGCVTLGAMDRTGEQTSWSSPASRLRCRRRPDDRHRARRPDGSTGWRSST